MNHFIQYIYYVSTLSQCRALMAFISYFVIGAIILRVRYQKSGSDLIINKEFWKDFPKLIKVHIKHMLWHDVQ